jgi:hypothetical protein
MLIFTPLLFATTTKDPQIRIWTTGLTTRWFDNYISVVNFWIWIRIDLAVLDPDPGA